MLFSNLVLYGEERQRKTNKSRLGDLVTLDSRVDGKFLIFNYCFPRNNFSHNHCWSLACEKLAAGGLLFGRRNVLLCDKSLLSFTSLLIIIY